MVSTNRTTCVPDLVVCLLLVLFSIYLAYKEYTNDENTKAAHGLFKRNRVTYTKGLEAELAEREDDALQLRERVTNCDERITKLTKEMAELLGTDSDSVSTLKDEVYNIRTLNMRITAQNLLAHQSITEIQDLKAQTKTLAAERESLIADNKELRRQIAELTQPGALGRVTQLKIKQLETELSSTKKDLATSIQNVQDLLGQLDEYRRALDDTSKKLDDCQAKTLLPRPEPVQVPYMIVEIDERGINVEKKLTKQDIGKLAHDKNDIVTQAYQYLYEKNKAEKALGEVEEKLKQEKIDYAGSKKALQACNDHQSTAQSTQDQKYKELESKCNKWFVDMIREVQEALGSKITVGGLLDQQLLQLVKLLISEKYKLTRVNKSAHSECEEKIAKAKEDAEDICEKRLAEKADNVMKNAETVYRKKFEEEVAKAKKNEEDTYQKKLDEVKENIGISYQRRFKIELAEAKENFKNSPEQKPAEAKKATESTQNQSHEAEIRQLKARVSEYEAEASTTNETINKLKNEVTRLQDTQDQTSGSTAKSGSNDGELDQLKKKLEESEQAVKDVRQEQDQQRKISEGVNRQLAANNDKCTKDLDKAKKDLNKAKE